MNNGDSKVLKMANWKLTPKKLGGNLIGFTPKWTSGSGSYRVKRFSTQFPFFAHGNDEVIACAIQLLRWSSKLDPKKDITVLMNLDGKLIHLFNAQPFVVECFRRLWLRSPVAEKLLFVEAEKAGRYDFTTSLCMTGQMAVVSEFIDSSLELSNRLTCTNHASAINIYEICKKGRKDREINLETIIDASSLIALSMDELKEFRKREDNNHLTIRIQRNSEFRVARNKGSAVNRNHASRLLKSINSDRTRVKLSEEESKLIQENRLLSQKERGTVFELGVCLFLVTGEDVSYEVVAFGSYFVVMETTFGSDFKSCVPFRDLSSSKKFIKLAQQSSSGDKKRLCLRVSVGVDAFGCAMIAYVTDSALEFFNDHWSGSSVSFCSFVSKMPVTDTADAMNLMQMVCRASYTSEIRSLSCSSR
ncbi:hypothetical protein QTV49_004248 [Vibrio vulnificus]|nr:hypothetical protein [Vibrio vulnificus]